jgi:glycosyltransferase involved in cell wall biosynthesis
MIVPAYNEEGRILETLEDYRKTLIGRYGDAIRIVVASDSTDGTNRIVSGYARRHRQVSLYIKKERQGKGAALLRGFQLACQDPDTTIVGFADADPSISGSEMVKMLECLNRKGVDGAIASRYVKGSRWIGRPRPSRLVASRCYNLMVRALFGFPYKDTQCGAKFFRKGALCSALGSIMLTDMSFDINLLYEMRKRKLNVVETPITYRWVNEGSTLRLKRQVPQMFMVALGYKIVRSPLKDVVPDRLKGFVYNLLKRW